MLYSRTQTTVKKKMRRGCKFLTVSTSKKDNDEISQTTEVN